MPRWLNRSALVLLGLLLATIATTAPRLTFDNDLLALFPQPEGYGAQRYADQQRAAAVTGKVLLLLSSDDFEATRDAALALATELSRCDCIARVKKNVRTDAYAALYQSYQDHLPNLLAPAHREQLSRGVYPLVQRTLQRLSTHPGPGVAHSLRTDPLGTLSAYQQWLRPPKADIRLDDSGLPVVTIDDKRHVLLEVELSGSPYSLSLQAAARQAFNRASARFQRLPGAQILRTGPLFYALAGSDQARGEVSTVGLGSVLGICVLMLLVFRSPLLLLLAFVPIAVGVGAGATATYWLFGSIHVMALVFGASLVGVAIDYSMHCFARRQFLGPQWRVWEDMGRLWVPLTLGLCTSSVAYLSFTLAGFPGFSQIAVFSAAGLVSAYLVVVALYPYCLGSPSRRPPPAALSKTLQRWERWHRKVASVPITVWTLLICGALGSVVFATSNDDIRQMQQPDPALQREETKVRQALGADTALAYILVDAPDRQTLLERLEALEPTLESVLAKGNLTHYDSLAQFIPSPERQTQNQRLWRQALASEAIDPLWQSLTPPVRASLEERLANDSLLQWSTTWPLVSALPDAPLYFVQSDTHYATVALSGLKDSETLNDRLNQFSFAQWVDPVARTNGLLEQYRQAATYLLLLAYAGVIVALCLRYGWRGAIACVAPPALASLLTVAIQSALGQSISVFHMMALLLVLGIGIDYTLFIRESKGEHRDTLLAIGLSTLTTVLSFGLLSLSATAAIAGFGATVLLGITLSFLLAPLALGPHSSSSD